MGITQGDGAILRLRCQNMNCPTVVFRHFTCDSAFKRPRVEQI